MAIPGTVTVTGPIAPNATGDTYPVTDAIYGLDGLRNVSSTTERNAIPSLRRKEGMIVGVPSGGTQSYWRLKASPWNNNDDDWVLQSGGYGITGVSLDLSGYKLKLDGTPYEADLGILASDVTVTGGTYYPTSITDPADSGKTINAGTARFFLNTISGNSSFDVQGFLTGYTDTRVINTTSYSNGTLTIKQDQGASDINVTGFTSITGGSINGSTISLTSSNAEPITISGLTNIYTSNGSITTNRNIVLSNDSRLSFGGAVENKFGIDLKLEQGNSNTSNSNYSHSEGLSNVVGYYGYTPTDITNGIIVLDSKYGDVVSSFGTPPQNIMISNTDNSDSILFYPMSAKTYDEIISATTIYLLDTGLTLNIVDYIITPLDTTNSTLADISAGGYSHVEGITNTVFGYGSHAEGLNNKIYSIGSHAEGSGNIVFGDISHAEGVSNITRGEGSHVEGATNNTYGDYSHAEGFETTANGQYSHAEGAGTESNGESSHAEGDGTVSNGDDSHSEGQGTISVGLASHSEGVYTNAGFIGFNYFNIVSGLIKLESSYSSAVTFSSQYLIIDDSGNSNEIGIKIVPMPGSYGFDGTYVTIQLDDTSLNSSSGGNLYEYYGVVDLVPSINPLANTINGQYSHSEGKSTSSYGTGSHSEGILTIALGDYSHTEGTGTTAYGFASHASGFGTIAEHNFQTVIGTYNTTDETPTDTLFVIGNGNPQEGRSDLLVATTTGLTLNSDFRIKGDVTINDGDVKITGLSINEEIDYLVSVTALGVIVKTPISGISSQEITIVGGDNISIGGSYPDFTIDFTGTTGGGDFLPLSGGTLTDTLVGTTISATTISGGTFYGDGQYLTGIQVDEVTISNGDNISVTGSYPDFTIQVTGITDSYVLLDGDTMTGTLNVPIVSATTISGTTLYGDGQYLSGIPKDFLPLSGGTVTGGTIFQSGITANTITSDSLSEIVTGTTRLVEATSGGTLTATRTIVNSFILDPTAIAILEDVSSWDGTGQFVGPPISDTYQGQSYYNSNYYFVAVDDNLWIRLIRG